ncbi:glycosyltransferase family 39 protein [bacterium]|nr:glycosyltransferase family 39 protein [bacterium]
MTTEPMTLPPVPRWLLVLAGILLFAYAPYAMLRGLDPDEVQMTAAAYAVAHGQQLYTQVWDNHGPLVAEGIAVLIRLFDPDSYEFLYVLRGVMLALMSAGFVFFWRTSRHVFAEESRLPIIALILFAASPALFEKSWEIRGDNPMNILWIASLMCWFAAWRKEKYILWLLSGALVGACFFFSLKTLFLGFSAGLMFIAAMIFRRKLMVVPLALYGAGSMITPAIMSIGFKISGNGAAFIEQFVGKNMDRARPPIFEGFDEFTDLSTIWAYATLLVLGWTAYRIARRKAPAEIAILWPAAAFLVFQYMFLMPTFHYQSLLVVAAPIALLSAWALCDVADSIARSNLPITRREPIIVTGLVLAVIAMMDTERKAELILPNEIALGNSWQEVIPKNTTVFDGYGHPLFRPHPFEYKAFVTTLRDRYEAGDLPIDVPRGLERENVLYVVYDKRVRKLGADVVLALRASMVPLKTPGLLAAGKVVERGDAEEVEVVIPREAEYYFGSAENGDAVEWLLVNGDPVTAPGPVFLKADRVMLDWDGDGPLLLCVAKPDEWNRKGAIISATEDLPDPGDEKATRTIWPEYFEY